MVGKWGVYSGGELGFQQFNASTPLPSEESLLLLASQGIWERVQAGQRKQKDVCVSRSVVSDSLPLQGLQPAMLLCPWNSLGKNTGVGYHSLLQGIFLTQGWILSLPYCRQILYQLSYQGSPQKAEHMCRLSRSVLSDSSQPYGLQPTRLLCPQDSPGKNTGVGCHGLLQGIFLTQGSNPESLMSPALTGEFFTTVATWEAPEKARESK